MPINPNKPWDLSDEYWSSLSERDRHLYGVVQPMPKATYVADQGLSGLEHFLQEMERDLSSVGGRFELEPDFQRGHVWTQEQRTRFMEAMIRQQTTPTIIFNCPDWTGKANKHEPTDIGANVMQCVDGLQRLTAMRMYMAGEVEVFGGMTVRDLDDSAFSVKRSRLTFKMQVFEYSKRAELLDFYLRLNAGGTVHSEDELQRVAALRELALSDSAEPSPAVARRPRP